MKIFGLLPGAALLIGGGVASVQPVLVPRTGGGGFSLAGRC